MKKIAQEKSQLSNGIENNALKNSEKPTKISQDADWVPPDGGWGWVCVFSSFITFYLVSGVNRTFGVIYNDVRDEFSDAKHIQIAMIPAMVLTLAVGFTVVSGALTAAFSCRKVAFVGGLLCGTGMCLSSIATSVTYIQCMFLLSGIGASLVCTPGVLIVPKYFRKRRGQAMGLALCGAAIGALTLPSFVRYLADIYGFRGTLLIQGGLLYNTSVAALLYREPNSNVKQATTQEKSKLQLNDAKLEQTSPKNLPQKMEFLPKTQVVDKSTEEGHYEKSTEPRTNCCFRWVNKYLYTDLTLLHNPLFIIVLFSTFFMSIGYPQCLTFFPPYAQSFGYSAYYGGLLLSISSVGDLTGRFSSGWILDKGIITKLSGYIVCTGGLSLSMICIGVYPNYFWISFCVFFFGYFGGSIYLVIPVLLSEHFGVGKLSTTFGIVRSFQGLSCLIGSPIAGYVRDVTGNFQCSLIVLGCLTIISTLSILLFSPIRRNYIKKQNPVLNNTVL